MAKFLEFIPKKLILFSFRKKYKIFFASQSFKKIKKSTTG
jgi:hypothetical protein